MNNRQRRLDRKYKMQLLCENCRRWTHVGYEFWRKLCRDDRGNPKEYVFFCRRERCIKSRPEGLIPRKTDGKKKNKKNTRQSTQHQTQSKV